MSVPAINSVAWFEIGTDRPREVKEFYGQLFGWAYSLNRNCHGHQ
jgi:predicted enzyme related to lactoylglutathione lyase